MRSGNCTDPWAWYLKAVLGGDADGESLEGTVRGEVDVETSVRWRLAGMFSIGGTTARRFLQWRKGITVFATPMRNRNQLNRPGVSQKARALLRIVFYYVAGKPDRPIWEYTAMGKSHAAIC